MSSYSPSLKPIFIRSTDTHNATTSKQSIMISAFTSENHTAIYAPTMKSTFIEFIHQNNSPTRKQSTLKY